MTTSKMQYLASSLCVLLGGCHVSSSSDGGRLAERQPHQETEPVSTQALGRPVIQAEVLPWRDGLRILEYKGEIHITREGRDIENLGVGEKIMADDLLKLTSGASVTLVDDSDQRLTIGYEEGEWFRFTR